MKNSAPAKRPGQKMVLWGILPKNRIDSEKIVDINITF